MLPSGEVHLAHVAKKATNCMAKSVFPSTIATRVMVVVRVTPSVSTQDLVKACVSALLLAIGCTQMEQIATSAPITTAILSVSL